MEMQENNHFTITRLVKSMLDIIIQNINLVSTNASILESIDMSFEDSREAFLGNIRPDIKIFQFGVSFSLIDHQLVLLDQISLFFLFRLPGLVLLLDVLDQLEGCVQVGTRSVDFSGFFNIRTSVGPEMLMYAKDL